MMNKNNFTRYLILVLPLLFINLNAQDQVDPLEAARLANSAAEKAQAEADAATEAAIQAAAEKAATQARSDAVQAREDEKARKLAETDAAEEAEFDAIAKAASDEAKKKIAQELGLDDDSTDFDEVETEDPLFDFAVGDSLILGFSLNGGLPIYSAAYLSSYSAGVTGGLTIHTSHGFNVGPLAFSTNLNVLYIDYGVESGTGLDEFGNLGVFAQFSTNTSEQLNFIPAATSVHFGVGFLPKNGLGFNAGGGLALPLNLPVGIGIMGNATISQTPDGNITGWLSAGLGISYPL